MFKLLFLFGGVQWKTVYAHFVAVGFKSSDSLGRGSEAKDDCIDDKDSTSTPEALGDRFVLLFSVAFIFKPKAVFEGYWSLCERRGKGEAIFPSGNFSVQGCPLKQSYQPPKIPQVIGTSLLGREILIFLPSCRN